MRCRNRKSDRMMCFGPIFRQIALVAAIAMAGTTVAVPAVVHAEGVRILAPLMRAVGDQRPVAEGSRVSLRVIRPKLEIAQDRAVGSVVGLSISADGKLLFILLEDGDSRAWDLEKGVQLGGTISDQTVAGTVTGTGREAEIVTVRRNGSLTAVQPGGSVRRLGAVGESVGFRPAPVWATEGSAVAFPASAGGWSVVRGGQQEHLADAVPAFAPILSPDGLRAVYGLPWGTLITTTLFGTDRTATGLRGCAEASSVLAGAFLPDGKTLVLGDDQGNVCIMRSPDWQASATLQVLRGAHDAPVRIVVVDRGGRQFATRDDRGRVHVWSVSPQPRLIAAFHPASKAAGPIVIDAERRWVFAGEEAGTVGIYAYSGEAEVSRIAGLICTNGGEWAVVDRDGRFDGPQDGVDALLWAGDTAADTLPVNAFSESWFEPGLLGKLDDVTPRFLNEEAASLSEDGYVPPPGVSVDPVDVGSADADGQLWVRVRLDDPEYPPQELLEVRLYHNGKLVPQDRMRATAGGGIFEYAIRLLPGANRFHAIGVGSEGIEGEPSATVVVASPLPDRERPLMQVLSVGINDYVRPTWKLSYGRNDAVAVAEILRNRGNGLFEDVLSVTLLDADANAAAIKDQIALESPSARDVLVVYFSGHGAALPEEDGWEWYLLPFTRAWDVAGNVTESMVRQYGVSSRDLMRLLTRTQASRVFMILDSCRSGAVADALGKGMFDEAVGQKALRRIARVGGIHVLAASRGNEDAFELVSEPHGALTYLLLEGIRGAADNNLDGEVSVREVVDYATREMPLLSRRLITETITQLPVGYSRGADFALAGSR